MEATPGPWTVGHDGETAVVDAGSFGPVARIDSGHGPDAVLIAAAPELLEAIEQLSDMARLYLADGEQAVTTRDWLASVGAAEAAIAKATA